MTFVSISTPPLLQEYGMKKDWFETSYTETRNTAIFLCHWFVLSWIYEFLRSIQRATCKTTCTVSTHSTDFTLHIRCIFLQFIYINQHVHLITYNSWQGSNSYTGCNRRNGPDFGRVFLRSNYTDITQNTYIQSWTVTEIMASEIWNIDSYYSLIDYQIHIETGRNMWFL